jgi:DNA-binding GntR family transcriptional regulator
MCRPTRLWSVSFMPPATKSSRPISKPAAPQPTNSAGMTTGMLTDALRTEIMEGQLEAGLPLRQEDLAIRFGTSRIPIREALRTLQAEGLVTYSPNRGATVTIVSAEEIQEMLEVRIALECHALRLATPRLAESDIAAARAILQDYDAAPDPDMWSTMNWRFHWSLYQPCDCSRLLDAIERNFKHFSSAARAQMSALAGKERPQREHHRLLALMEEGKVEEAATLLASHIRNTQRSMRAWGRSR